MGPPWAAAPQRKPSVIEARAGVRRAATAAAAAIMGSAPVGVVADAWADHWRSAARLRTVPVNLSASARVVVSAPARVAHTRLGSAPTLIADGTIDRLDPVANDYALAKLIEGAKLKLYPDAGHTFLFQDEETFVSLIESFLR